MDSASPLTYDVFISHAGEDKMAIAMPLREELSKHGIRAFVDEADMHGGTHAETAMTNAMKTARVAVVILSPEFVARKWPMRELLCFLRRTEKPLEDEQRLSAIIPLFYRLSIPEMYEEPRFDRVDANGVNLYRKARFEERKAKGEPEADVTNIKTALGKLHGFMGVENYLNASNESTSEMSKRREDLLKRLSEAIRKSHTMVDNGNGFRCHYHTEKDKVIRGLVLDFQRADKKGKTPSTESEILQAILDTSKNDEIISVRGIAGVGKSSILQGLSNRDDVKKRYKDGIHLLRLGADATRNQLIESLCEIVNISGGVEHANEMRKLSNCAAALDAFQSWFYGRDCLFMIDDVWETEEISSDIVEGLRTLDFSRTNSKILFSTRNIDIAGEADKRFVLHPRDPHSAQCLAILSLYSGIEVDESNVQDKQAANAVLTRCSGLPLFLIIAGKAVKQLNDKLDNGGCDAYHVYASKLDVQMQRFLNTPVGSYKRLSLTLSLSVQLVEDRKDGWGFQTSLKAPELHRRLSAVPRLSRVPMTTLKYLWELRSEEEASFVAEEFDRVGLATLEIEVQESAHSEMLSLHDSLHEYAKRESRRYGEAELGHKIVLEGYGRGIGSEVECRAWWSERLEMDGYVHRHVCRHLQLAGLIDEMVMLLLVPEWTVRCFETCGILDLEQDYIRGTTVLKKKEEEAQECQDLQDGVLTKMSEKEGALQAIVEAVKLSSGFNIRRPRELCFQLYGRLKIYSEQNIFIKEYVNRLELKAKMLWGPFMKCISPALTPCGGATRKILHVGPGIDRMSMSEDGRFLFCGCTDRVVVIVDLRNSEILKQWRLPVEGVFRFSNHGKFIFCASISRSYEVTTTYMFETHTGKLEGTFHVVDRLGLTCVELMQDSRLIMAGTGDRMVQVWTLDRRQLLLAPFPVHDGHVLCMTSMRDEEHFVSGGTDEKLRIWSATSGQQSGAPFVGHSGSVNCVAILPDRSRIVSGSSDGTVRIWNIRQRTQVGMPFAGHHGPVTCVYVNKKGNLIASGSDTTILVWDLQSGGKVLYTLNGLGGMVTGVLFHPVDSSVISCSSDGNVRFWDLSRAKAEKSLHRNYSLYGVSFTDDGKYLLHRSGNRSLHIWDTHSERRIGKLSVPSHLDYTPNCGVVTPDGRLVVCLFVREEKMMHLVWDLQSQQLLQEYDGYTLDFAEQGRLAIIVDSGVSSVLHGNYKYPNVHMRYSCQDSEHRAYFDVTGSLEDLLGELGKPRSRWSRENIRDDEDFLGKFYMQGLPDYIMARGPVDLGRGSVRYDGPKIWYTLGNTQISLGILESKLRGFIPSPAGRTTICAVTEDKNAILMKLEDGTL